MKPRLVTAAALLGTLVATPVLAQEAQTTAPIDAAIAEAAKPPARFTVGAQLELMPTGSFDVALTGPGIDGSASFDTTTAFGLSGVFAYDVAPHISIGVAPRLVLGVNFTVPEETRTADDAKQLDLRARVAVHGEIAPQLQLYGFATPGYSWLIPPDDDNLSGFSIGFGAGASYDLAEDIFVNAELGYQIAYYNDDDAAGNHADVDVSYLHLGIGGGARF